MKKGSYNSRQSAILDVIKRIRVKDIQLVTYKTVLSRDEFYNYKVFERS